LAFHFALSGNSLFSLDDVKTMRDGEIEIP